MEDKTNKSWHLASNAQEIAVTEFEFQLWRVFNGFLRWQEDCQRYVGNEELNGYELALLHIIRMKNRPKTIYDLSRLLNRDDPNNIQYSLSKLLKYNLIEKLKSSSHKKTLSYQITKKGIKNTNIYTKARSQILISLFKEHNLNIDDLRKTANILISIRSIYEEASRLALLIDPDNE